MRKKNLLLLCILFTSMAVFAQFPVFSYHLVGETQELTGQTSLADVDKDGDQDWIIGSVDSVWWFEFQNPDLWVKHTIGAAPGAETGGIAIDIDGDGWIDQVSGSTWYKNPGTTGKIWTRYVNKAIIAQECVAADINSDGKQDIVMMNDETGLYWYNFSGNPTKNWKGTRIGDGVRSGIGPMGVADLDKDGDMDIVRSNAWFENVDQGRNWNEKPNLKLTHADINFPNSSKCWIADIDGDTKLDIIQAESFYPDCRVVYEVKMDQKGLNWFLKVIDGSTLQEIQSLAVADFDLDGDLDVFVGGSSRTKDFHKRCFIYENADGKAGKWQKHEILTDKECHDAKAADVDGDGDIDIVGKPWYGTSSFFLQNMLKEGK
jgi:hypothetical protein